MVITYKLLYIFIIYQHLNLHFFLSGGLFNPNTPLVNKPLTDNIVLIYTLINLILQNPTTLNVNFPKTLRCAWKTKHKGY